MQVISRRGDIVEVIATDYHGGRRSSRPRQYSLARFSQVMRGGLFLREED